MSDNNKWLLATLNQLNRAYEFEFKHANVDYRHIEDVVEEVAANLQRRAHCIAEEEVAVAARRAQEDGDFALDEDEDGENEKEKSASSGATAVVVSDGKPASSTNKKPSLIDLLSDTIFDVAAAGGNFSPSTATTNGNSSSNSMAVLASGAVPSAAGARSMSGTEYRPSPDDNPSSIPSDRSWENSLPRILRERACALRAEVVVDRSHTDKTTAQIAYERRCAQSDRDICNFLGSVMAVDFRHWIAGTHGEEVGKVSLCWCRERSSPVLPCRCMNEGNKTAFEPNVQQMWGRDAVAGGKIVRGSAAMVARMRDAVDEAAEGDPNKYWFRPQVLIRRLLVKDNNADGVADGSRSDDGRFEMIDELFTGCDEQGKRPLQFPAVGARIRILTEVAEFFERTGKDFYDLVVESGRRLIGAPGALSGKDSVPELNSTGLPFQHLPGLLPAMCRNIPRFLDTAQFSRPEAPPLKTGNEGEGGKEEEEEFSLSQPEPKFTVSLRVDETKEKSFLKREGSPFRTRDERRDAAAPDQSKVTVLFLKLAQLFAVALRSCRGLFASKDLKWLRDNEPFLDEEEHLTICSDYQIPNALRFSGLIHYSPELAEDVATRRMLPSQSLKEVEVRLSSVIAATALRERFIKKCDSFVQKKQQDGDDREQQKKSNKKQKMFDDFYAAFFRRARDRFTTSVLDYVIWLFGRGLTGAKLGHPHHLTPGIMY